MTAEMEHTPSPPDGGGNPKWDTKSGPAKARGLLQSRSHTKFYQNQLKNTEIFIIFDSQKCLKKIFLKEPSTLQHFAWSNQIRKNKTLFGYKFRPRSHSALDGPQLPKTSPRKNGKTSIFSGAQKIELHNSTFFWTIMFVWESTKLSV